MYWFVLGCDQLSKINYMCKKKKKKERKNSLSSLKGQPIEFTH